jgi:hypothetical protein
VTRSVYYVGFCNSFHSTLCLYLYPNYLGKDAEVLALRRQQVHRPPRCRDAMSTAAPLHPAPACSSLAT